MKKFWTLAFLFLFLISCEKDEPLKEYIPWKPDTETEETDDLKEKYLLITEQAGNKVLMIETVSGRNVWTWDPEVSDLPVSCKKWFDLPSEAKPVMGGKCVLITASKGGVCLVRISDKKILFYAKPGGNPHSAELLPDGNIIVASSSGNKLSVYGRTESDPSRPLYTFPLEDAHNIVWDQKRNCLWTASGKEVLKLSYNSTDDNISLSTFEKVPFPPGNSTPHDLYPVYGKDMLFLTTAQNVYQFDCKTYEYRTFRIFQRKNLKSISSGPEGYRTVVVKPTQSWWSRNVKDLSGNDIYNNPGYEIYKARWFLDNTLGTTTENNNHNTLINH